MGARDWNNSLVSEIQLFTCSHFINRVLSGHIVTRTVSPAAQKTAHFVTSKHTDIKRGPYIELHLTYLIKRVRPA